MTIPRAVDHETREGEEDLARRPAVRASRRRAKARVQTRGQICAPALDHAVEAALIYGEASWRAATRAGRLDAISEASIVSRSAS